MITLVNDIRLILWSFFNMKQHLKRAFRRQNLTIVHGSFHLKHSPGMPPVIIISAMTKDLIIGNNEGNGMPWNIPEEFNKFLGFIRGQSVIMGRVSWEVFKTDMPSKQNFIVSRSIPSLDEANICKSVEEAITKARSYPENIFVAGGHSIYKEALPLADFMYLSFIKEHYEGRTSFPEFDRNDWDIIEETEYDKFIFNVFQRKRNLVNK